MAKREEMTAAEAQARLRKLYEEEMAKEGKSSDGKWSWDDRAHFGCKVSNRLLNGDLETVEIAPEEE